MPGQTRGPLPRSVYWRRRLVLLTVVVVLVVAVVWLLHRGGGDSTAAGLTDDTPSAPVLPSETTSPTQSISPTQSVSTSPTPTTTPGGPCLPSDVSVLPHAASGPPNEPVTITLQLSTTISSCIWKVAPSTMQVAVTQGGAVVWSTALCRQAMPSESLTLTSAAPTQVTLTWEGHKADSDCSSHAAWAGFGDYGVEAAALGGEPGESTFALERPTSTPSVPSPSTTPTTTASSDPSRTPSGSTSKTPKSTTKQPSRSATRQPG